MRPAVLSILAFVCGLPLHGQTDSYELPQRALRRVRDSSEQLAKLVCTEAMEPGKNIGAADGVPQWDRVRADVLATSEGERYSWPGQDQFINRDLLRLVRIRPLSTGGFSDFLSSIFALKTGFRRRRK